MKITSEKVSFDGPAGTVQAILDIPAEIKNNDFISVNCHPHSLYGGSMTNKVTHTVARAAAGAGIPSLRFNFRGVDKSEGEYDEGRGEQKDLAAAVAWMRREYPARELILSGFSFGAYVSAFAANDLEPSLLLSIAPPVMRFDFGGFERPRSDWRVIMGDLDELVAFSDVTRWVESFELRPELIVMAQASHFFHGQLIGLRENVEKCIHSHLFSKGLT